MIENISNKTVLMIDNEGEFLESMKSLLEYEGYIVTTEEDIRKMYELATNNVFDFVVCDLVNPFFNLIDVFKKIEEKQAHTSFVIMTGSIEVDGPHYKGYPLILKPFPFQDLIKILKTF